MTYGQMIKEETGTTCLLIMSLSRVLFAAAEQICTGNAPIRAAELPEVRDALSGKDILHNCVLSMQFSGFFFWLLPRESEGIDFDTLARLWNDYAVEKKQGGVADGIE